MDITQEQQEKITKLKLIGLALKIEYEKAKAQYEEAKAIEEQVKTMTPLDVFNNSYKFACEQEIYGAIDFACDDTYTGNEDYAEGFENIERLIDYKGNLLEYLIDEYINFRHPEYYNIFGGYEDTLNIIQIIIDECMGEENDRT